PASFATVHPAEMGTEQVGRFLSSLAVEGNVSASTQNQALAALLFLYGQVLGTELPSLTEVVRVIEEASTGPAPRGLTTRYTVEPRGVTRWMAPGPTGGE